MNLQNHYKAQSDELGLKIKVRKLRGRSYVAGEIVSFLAMIGFVVLFTMTESPHLRLLEMVSAAVCLVLYVVVRVIDTRNDARIRRLEDLKQVYDNEQSALRGDFSCFDTGQRYVDAHHAYSFDLDIFGKESLYQRMCRMVTTGGRDAFAARLCSLDGDVEQVGQLGSRWAYGEDYRARIMALAGDERFRSEFIAYGVGQPIDTDAIGRALEEAGQVEVGKWFAHRATVVLAVALLLSFFAAIVLAIVGKVSFMLPLWWGIIQFFAVAATCQGPLRRIGKAVNRLEGQLQRFVSVVKLVNNGQAEPFKRLSGLLDGLDKRGNVIGLFVVDTFALYDLFLVRKFMRWAKDDAQEVKSWIDKVVETDQDVTVATFLYNHPQTVWAELTDADGVMVEAKGLCHPFLGERAVRNDFRVDDQNFYIVTGANMAGKSTFLRSVGVNYILAMTGMPVFANSLRVSRFNLFSSMRTTDDLAHGISYFNAELIRLEQLIDYCRQKRHTLIILDEILKGTNSLDKLNGSRLFLESIAGLPVSGIIATHDLELSKMEGERYHNFCFEIELGDDVTYSYKITPGVAQNQNATFLLNRIIGGRQSK